MSQTLRCKPLSECTADDVIPMNARLRADAIDYLAHAGRDVSFCGPNSCGLDHLLRLCADVDESGGGLNSDGILSIFEGGFAGHFAPPSIIARMRADEQAAAAARPTREQLLSLEQQAGIAGDWEQVALCRLARGRDLGEETIGGRDGDTILSRPRTRAQALAECANVLAD